MTNDAPPEGGSDQEPQIELALHFSEYFDIDPDLLGEHGAFNISVISDLPLFIDPFLLFNSEKPEYQGLHRQIIDYLIFLRDKAVAGAVDEGLLKAWFYFKEVKQNWLGFTVLGNGGHALGADFARALRANLAKLFGDESDEVTKGRHLEKLSLIRGGVGRDNISDFTTNLIKGYLLDYTQRFTLAHVNEADRGTFRVRKVRFNYTTESWEDGTYVLPRLGDDFVLLTPEDMLTRDDTWINRSDLINGFSHIPPAISDEELRSQISNYFISQLKPKATKKERDAAVQATIDRFPQLLDYYIALKELEGPQAVAESTRDVSEADQIFVAQLKKLIADLIQRTAIYKSPVTSYEEALGRVRAFKQYVENQDGYRLINRGDRPFSSETEVQLYFGLALIGTTFDVNREPNNGRGPVDYKLSHGAFDKSLIEFKLGSNTQLRRNLQRQVEIYEAANQTSHSVKVIINYTEADEQRVRSLLEELKLTGREDIITIDARSDNKPSASKA